MLSKCSLHENKAAKDSELSYLGVCGIKNLSKPLPIKPIYVYKNFLFIFSQFKKSVFYKMLVETSVINC